MPNEKRQADTNSTLNRAIAYAEEYLADLDKRRAAGDEFSGVDMRNIAKLIPALNAVRRDEQKTLGRFANASPDEIADAIISELGADVVRAALARSSS